VVNPLRKEDSQRQLQRYGNHPRFVGIKTIQDAHGLTLASQEYAFVHEAAAELSLPIMAHLPGCDEAARVFPQVNYFIAHGNWGRAKHLAPYSNIHFDFAMSHAFRHETQLKEFISLVGVDRMLFGSDALLMTPSW